ncbi:hypothetical protein ACMGDH_13395 [Sphingomonas sp. DT-207]|uniref:hypothetical protein n=1 Tax=Sphingomonas sp. DT-207 TaxID=3396167 RepID=UPI003F1AD06E
MAFDLGNECASIVDALPDTLPNQSYALTNSATELAELRQRIAMFAAEAQQAFPNLAGKKLGGMGKLYVFDPNTLVETVERDVVRYWLQRPESLELSAAQVAALASNWYSRPISEHRIKRRFNDPVLITRLQSLCYELGNATDISKCRSLTEIRKRLRLRFRQSGTGWTFRGEITFHDNGTVTIGDLVAQQDQTAAGRRRVRGNGSAVSIDALRNVLLAHS